MEKHRLQFSVLVRKVIPDGGLLGKEWRIEHDKDQFVDMKAAELLAGPAHDMRAPMKYVLSFLDAQSQTIQSDAQFSRAKNAAIRVDMMIDALKRLAGDGMVLRQTDTFSFESVIEFANTLAAGFDRRF